MLNRLQSSPNNQKYHTKRMEIKVGPPAMEPNILNAALAAAEAIHASVQIVPQVGNDTIAPNQEGRSEHDVPVQPKTGETPSEGTPGGAQ